MEIVNREQWRTSHRLVFYCEGLPGLPGGFKKLSEGLWWSWVGLLFVRVRVSLSLGYEARNGKRGGSSVEVFGSKFLNNSWQNKEIGYNRSRYNKTDFRRFWGTRKVWRLFESCNQVDKGTRLRFVSKKLTHNSQKVKYPSIAIPKKNPSFSIP